ncbi:MAG: hypothetical protein GOV01_03060 [Candidatus Altiarchaeota archaeon]|nr:hypothetical protein [Candidatus Altiarchaeota archaeon]
MFNSSYSGATSKQPQLDKRTVQVLQDTFPQSISDEEIIEYTNLPKSTSSGTYLARFCRNVFCEDDAPIDEQCSRGEISELVQLKRSKGLCVATELKKRIKELEQTFYTPYDVVYLNVKNSKYIFLNALEGFSKVISMTQNDSAIARSLGRVKGAKSRHFINVGGELYGFQDSRFSTYHTRETPTYTAILSVK